MTEAVRRLRELQDLDRDLRARLAERDALPREIARREAAVAALRAEGDGVRTEHRRILARVKEVENESLERRERIAKLEVQGNMARHTAELLALQHQTTALRNEISALEDEGIALLDRGEELLATERRSRERLVEEEAVFARFREAANADLTTLDAAIGELRARRDSLAAGVDAEDLGHYERLLAARGGEAVASVESQICQGCFVEIPPNDFVRLVRAKEIVHCRHCQRMLLLATEGAASRGTAEDAPAGSGPA